MQVEFHRDHGVEYSVFIHRPDGVVVSLSGVGGRWPVPHDLAHVATERALGLSGGVFGSAMAGAMFAGMVVVSGRQRRDPKRRSQEILRTNTKSRAITVAEVMASLVHDVVQHDVVQHGGRPNGLIERARTAWGTVREDAFPFTAAQFQTAVQDLKALSDQWTRTPPGAVLDVEWPAELVTSPPARSRPKSR